MPANLARQQRLIRETEKVVVHLERALKTAKEAGWLGIAIDETLCKFQYILQNEILYFEDMKYKYLMGLNNEEED